MFFVWISLPGLLQSQGLAVIQDPDGYTNVRAEASNQSKILTRVLEHQVFWVGEQTEDSSWWKVYHGPYQGYMHGSRILLLGELPRVPVLTRSNSLLQLANEDWDINIRIQDYQAHHHELIRDSIHHYIKLIDGKPSFGTALSDKLPRKEFQQIRVSFQGKSLLMPDSAWRDLFEPSFQFAYAAYGPGKHLYIHMSNSDGAGGYFLIWIFHQNRYLKREILVP